MRPALRLLLVLCGSAFGLAACETAPVTGRSQIMLVGENEELQMGLQAYREVLSREPLSHDAQINALVEKAGERIAAAAERPPGELWRAPLPRLRPSTTTAGACLHGSGGRSIHVCQSAAPRRAPSSSSRGRTPGARGAGERPDGGIGRATTAAVACRRLGGRNRPIAGDDGGASSGATVGASCRCRGRRIGGQGISSC
jgi:hypothetical protein